MKQNSIIKCIKWGPKVRGYSCVYYDKIIISKQNLELIWEAKRKDFILGQADKNNLESTIVYQICWGRQQLRWQNGKKICFLHGSNILQELTADPPKQHYINLVNQEKKY